MEWYRAEKRYGRRSVTRLDGEVRVFLTTGSRGSGKTTLLERLLKEGMLPGGEQAGIRSFALRNEDGTPSQIILEDRSDGQQQAIAEGFVPGKGPKVKAEVLDHFGVQAIEHAKSRFWVLGGNG